jgi:ferredoxin
MSLRLKVKTRRGEQELTVTDKNQSVLESLEKAKIKFPFGCRSASCGVCSMRIEDGADLLEKPLVVESDTLKRCGDGSNVRLACRAHFKSDSNGTFIFSAVDEE